VPDVVKVVIPPVPFTPVILTNKFSLVVPPKVPPANDTTSFTTYPVLASSPPSAAE